MRKILIAVAASIAVAAGLVSTPPSSEARGFRLGIGFGMPLRSLIQRRVRPRVIILRSMGRARERARARDAARAAAVRARQAAEARAEARAEAAARARQQKAVQAKAAPKPTEQEDDMLRRAQLEQQAKAEELLRQLSGYKPTSATQPTAPRAAPAPERQDPPQAEPPKAKPPKASCKRFLPGADAIVSVPCTD